MNPISNPNPSKSVILSFLLSEIASHPVHLETLTKQPYKLWCRIFIKVSHNSNILYSVK